MIKRVFSAILFMICCSAAFSQIAVEDYSGRPFRLTTNDDVAGSPFLFEDWMPGKVILTDGNAYDNLMLKFDELHGNFLFNRNDSSFELGSNVTEVVLKNVKDNGIEMDFKKIVSTDDRSPMTAFVQVLSSGKVPLYKQYTKKIEGENTSNGLFTSEKKMVPHNSLWTIVNGKTITVKLNSGSLEELTSDKKDPVFEYVKAKKLNLKNEKDFAAALTYYNSISKTQ